MGSDNVEIAKGIQAIDLALYLTSEKALVLADLHIGIEDSLVKQGMLVPKFHFRDLVDRVQEIFDRLAAQKKEVDVVVINGDLKHEFGTISDEEWRNTLKMLDWLGRKCKKIVLVKGNHDKILGPIADKRKVTLVEELILGDKLICHGDRIPEILGGNGVHGAAPRQASLLTMSSTTRHPRKGRPPVESGLSNRETLRKSGGGAAHDTRGAAAGIKTIIIGHDHPAVSLYDELRKETYKAFLVGGWKRRKLIVQPSLNPLMEGTDVKQGKLLSPLLQRKLDDFEVYIVADKVYAFGKLKKITA